MHVQTKLTYAIKVFRVQSKNRGDTLGFGLHRLDTDVRRTDSCNILQLSTTAVMISGLDL